MCLNKQNSEYTSGPKFVKILKKVGFSTCERYAVFWICQNILCQSSEYILGSKYARILNMAGFWICHNMAKYALIGREYAWICLNFG